MRCRNTTKDCCSNYPKKAKYAIWRSSWQRGRIPILYYGEQVALVAGLFVCDGFLAPEEGVAWEWRPHVPQDAD